MQYTQQAAAVTAEVNKAVQGKQQTVNTIWMGKTTLALAFARALDLKESRVQFTPDVLPSDLVGFSVYQKETGKFVYHAGAVMCNLFLGDEINRTSSRTLYRNCNPEPHRRRRHADAAAVSAGPFHGLRRNGLPR